MKFNPTALKGLFSKLAKSGMADDVAKGLVNSADDVALGALNVADDIPQTHLLNSAIAFPQGTPDTPVNVSQFKDFYTKHRAEDVAARNLFEGLPYDKSALTPGFGYDFGIPDRDGGFLVTGSAGISPRGHEVVVPPEFRNAAYFADIDGKTFHLNGDYSKLLYDEDLKTELLSNHVWEALYDDVVPYADGKVPLMNKVFLTDNTWRPHSNEALAKFYKKNGRFPNGLNSNGFLPDWDGVRTYTDDDLPF